MGLLANILCCLLVVIGVFLKTTSGKNSEMQNVKTIKTQYGDIYDCIDFYEQPAFKHPRLQNHNFHPEMRPKFSPSWTTTTITTDTSMKASKVYELEDGGCPQGTVPIRRLSKEDRSRAHMFSKKRANSRLNTSPAHSDPGTYFAIAQTKSGSSAPKHYGVAANISVWNPQVQANQYSSGEIIIENGRDSLQVGWMVNPTMYKDNLTRMFLHTTAGDMHCYNTNCPAFVLISSQIAPDAPFSETSKPGAPKYNNFVVYRDPETGNWWLRVTDDHIPIGFWPETVFTDLKIVGTYVACGGETYSPPDQSLRLPPMGNGEFPIGDMYTDSFATHFSTVNESFHFIFAENTEEYVNNKKHYSVYDYPRGGKWGHVVFFGGHGG